VSAGAVTLRTIDATTVRAVCDLAVAPAQAGFVAANAVSLAQALFAPEAWYRAIYLDDAPAGFAMLSDDSLRDPVPAIPEIWLWRFMVDARYQGRGIGKAALRLVVDHARSRGTFSALLASYVPGPGSAGEFYAKLGFRPTGAVEDGEIVIALAL